MFRFPLPTVAFAATCAALLTACGGGNGADEPQTVETSPLVGTWVTEQCQRVSSIDGEPLDIWVKGQYQFTAAGTIEVQHFLYRDSSCLTDPEALDQDQPQAMSLTYRDLGAVTVEEGLTGRQLRVTMKVVYFQDESVVDNAYAVLLDGERLCTSGNLILGSSFVSIPPDGSTAIDFENCLRALP